MDKPENQQHGGPHAAEHRPHRKPIHHHPFFWAAAICMIVAMVVDVLTNNLSSARGGRAVQALAP